MRAVNVGNTLYYHTPRRNGGATDSSIIAKGIGALSAKDRVVNATGGSIADITSSSIIPTSQVVVVASSNIIVFATGSSITSISVKITVGSSIVIVAGSSTFAQVVVVFVVTVSGIGSADGSIHRRHYLRILVVDVMGCFA